MRLLQTAIIVFTAIILSEQSFAQIVDTPSNMNINADSLRRELDNAPYFGLYKDNYFIFGTSVGSKPSKQNTNIKFQISIAQRLTKSVLPFNSYLFLFYTQKAFWNVLEKSMPMTDLNFNPGIGLAKHLFIKNRYIGKLQLILEHESNGKDGINSRSWNKVSFGGNILIDPQVMVHAKFWIPIIDGGENRDILDYAGIYQMGTSFMSPGRRFGASVILTKRRGWNLNYNFVIELNYRIFRRDNQYLFLQYYNGYGEGLLEFKQFHSQLRVGLVIKPRLFSDY
ncbi:MAG: phospholipase A [Paramuribaculum sp.]|nr:phospholipase A [Paramuribaculum sp.]